MHKGYYPCISGGEAAQGKYQYHFTIFPVAAKLPEIGP